MCAGARRGFGQGMGRGRGAGRGMGLGAQQRTAAGRDEKSALEQEAGFLEKQLDRIKRQLTSPGGGEESLK